MRERERACEMAPFLSAQLLDACMREWVCVCE